MTLAVKILRRTLGSLITLFAISIAVFLLSSKAPGDQVETMLAIDGDMGGRTQTYDQIVSQYQRTASELGLYGPTFYFSVIPSHWPDTLWKIAVKQERLAAKTLLKAHGNWEQVQMYQNSLRVIEREARGDHTGISNSVRFLLLTGDLDRSKYLWSSIDEVDVTSPRLEQSIEQARDYWNELQGLRAPPIPFPKIVWYGSSCRYHQWLAGVFTGNFGRSVVDGRPSGSKVREAVKWTLRINITVLLLAFGISIPLGLAMARKQESRFDKWIGNTLFLFYAIPSFWLGTLLIVFLTTPEYAEWLDIFPAGGVGNYFFESGWKKTSTIILSLVLPVISLLLGSLAYITRQMRDSVVRESRKDYVRMARAKGLTEKQIYRSHILRNSLFPMITLVGSAIPASVSGSVVIEVLFGIPGMGRLMYSSILSQDWYVVYIMVLIAAVLTILGYLLSDILYVLADPRIAKPQAAKS